MSCGVGLWQSVGCRVEPRRIELVPGHPTVALLDCCLGSLEAGCTLWALCYGSRTGCEQFLRCCRAHCPAGRGGCRWECRCHGGVRPGIGEVVEKPLLCFYPFSSEKLLLAVRVDTSSRNYLFKIVSLDFLKFIDTYVCLVGSSSVHALTSHFLNNHCLKLSSLPSSNSQSLSPPSGSLVYSLPSSSSEHDPPSTSGCSSNQSARVQTQKELMKAIKELKLRLPAERKAKGHFSTLNALKYALQCVKQVRGEGLFFFSFLFFSKKVAVLMWEAKHR